LVVQRGTCKERGPGAAPVDQGRREARTRNEEEKGSTKGIISG